MDTMKIHALSGRREKEIPPNARHLDGRKFASVSSAFSAIITKNRAIIAFTDDADAKIHNLPGIRKEITPGLEEP